MVFIGGYNINGGKWNSGKWKWWKVEGGNSNGGKWNSGNSNGGKWTDPLKLYNLLHIIIIRILSY